MRLLSVDRVSILVPALDVWQESVVVLRLEHKLLLFGEECTVVLVVVLAVHMVIRVLVLIILNCVHIGNILVKRMRMVNHST